VAVLALLLVLRVQVWVQGWFSPTHKRPQQRLRSHQPSDRKLQPLRTMLQRLLLLRQSRLRRSLWLNRSCRVGQICRRCLRHCRCLRLRLRLRLGLGLRLGLWLGRRGEGRGRRSSQRRRPQQP
jgi:hypothetical protein